jgi:hypothetical protein
VKRLVLILALLVLSWNAANAQTFRVNLGIRLEGVPTAIYDGGAYPALGMHLGLESQWDNIAVGVRVSVSSALLVFWHAQADVYGAYTLADATTLYGGVGWGGVANLFGGSYNDWHALLGVRLGGGFFLEATPGIASGELCTQLPQPSGSCNPRTVQVLVLGLAIGWAWLL